MAKSLDMSIVIFDSNIVICVILYILETLRVYLLSFYVQTGDVNLASRTFKDIIRIFVAMQVPLLQESHLIQVLTVASSSPPIFSLFRL